MTRLSVNVNKIATLRNTRSIGIPDVLHLSAKALDAGAHGITVHPRPDQRHIRASDVASIAELVRRYPGAEYNIEGNPFHGLVEHCERVRPDQATLVPDSRDAFTSNQGWNLAGLEPEQGVRLRQAIDRLHATGARVSLFVDPIVPMMPLAKRFGADRIELYTEPYAAADPAHRAESLKLYAVAARAACQEGLGVNAGHDLNLENLGVFLNELGVVDEVSIGHALVADALEFGLEDTVRRYVEICLAHGP
ncbi:MAG: pyridoxine 5'-phosphate synthase [Polyangiaceae bacterium]|nr:pyridoxine 5'-phosphate synthase [Polyangiaceae bacterium]